MSTCHTVRFHVQNTQEREAREAIDASVSALIVENPTARLSVASQLEPREEHLEYVQVLVCDGSACTCDDPASALHALQQALRPLNGGAIDRQDHAVDHEGPAG